LIIYFSAADNVVVALYFAMLFALAGRPDVSEETIVPSSADVSDPGPKEETDISLPTLSLAVATSATLVTLGGFLSRTLFPGTSPLPTTSLLTVLAATLRPTYFRRLQPAGMAIGILLIQLFFAASGASGSIALVMRQAPSLFLYSALQVTLHFALLVGFGRFLLRLPLRELYLASNACVGGPTTAAAMAQAKGWKALVVPALLIGILGYATATAASLALVPVLLRLPRLILLR